MLLTLNNTLGKNLSSKFFRLKVGHTQSWHSTPFSLYQQKKKTQKNEKQASALLYLILELYSLIWYPLATCSYLNAN